MMMTTVIYLQTLAAPNNSPAATVPVTQAASSVRPAPTVPITRNAVSVAEASQLSNCTSIDQTFKYHCRIESNGVITFCISEVCYYL